MNFGICELSYIPVRAGLSHKSELMNQVLFGEIFEIIANRGEWVKVKLLHDNYEGYVEEATITRISSNSDLLNQYDDNIVCSDINNILRKNNKETLLIPIGSRIPKSILTENKFHINENSYVLENQFKNQEFSDKRSYIVGSVKGMINTPYLWGGRTGWGIDCSGFSQLIYRLIGINIPRDASQQVGLGKTLNFLSEAQPGDLAFFDNEDGEIVHVGIICDNNSIIHASKFVRIDTIDHQGIYNRTLKKYTHNLRVIKSIL